MVSQGEVAKGDGLWNQKGKGLKEVFNSPSWTRLKDLRGEG